LVGAVGERDGVDIDRRCGAVGDVDGLSRWLPGWYGEQGEDTFGAGEGGLDVLPFVAEVDQRGEEPCQ
jgi:hypothetical protein